MSYKVLAGMILSCALASNAFANGKGNGKGNGANNSTGEIVLRVNDHCEIYIDSEKDISNIVFNLGQSDENKIEYNYVDHGGATTADPLGNEYPIGHYINGIASIDYESVHVKAGNNGTRGPRNRGVGQEVFPTDDGLQIVGHIPDACAAQQCDYILTATDTFGDGWNDSSPTNTAFVDVMVNNISALIFNGPQNSSGPIVSTFTASTGDSVEFYYTDWRFDNENILEIADCEGFSTTVNLGEFDGNDQSPELFYSVLAPAPL